MKRKEREREVETFDAEVVGSSAVSVVSWSGLSPRNYMESLKSLRRSLKIDDRIFNLLARIRRAH